MVLTPDQSVNQQQNIYNKYKNLAPADISRRKAEDSALIDEVSKTTYDTVTGNKQPSVLSQGLGKFTNKVADQSVAQNSRTDSNNLQQSQLKESIIGQRQSAAIGNRATDITTREQKLKRAVAQRAFDMGMTGKELSLHADSAIADIGFEKMQEDYQAGRVTTQELQNASFKLAQRAQQLKFQNDKLLTLMKQEAAKDIASGNVVRAKERMTSYYESLKKQAKDAAAAANNAALIRGAFTVGGAIIGTVITPGAGTVAGAAIGGAVGGAAAGAAG